MLNQTPKQLARDQIDKQLLANCLNIQYILKSERLDLQSIFRLFFLFMCVFSFYVNDANGQVSISPSAQQNLCTGQTVNLTIQNSLSGSTFQWLKNGVNIDGATNSSYQVSSEGLYTAIVSTGTTSSSLNEVRVVYNVNPNVDFSFSPSSGCGKTTVFFTNNSDDGNTGSNTSLAYNWDFGNNKNSNKRTPDPVRYTPPPGSGLTTYSINLVVSNTSTNCSSTITRTIQLSRGSDASLTSDADIKLFNGEPYFTVCNSISSPIKFFNASTVSNSEYIIDWGDNSPIYSSSSFTDLTHTYSVGTYKMSLVAKGGTCNDTSFYNIFVGSNPSISVGNPGSTTTLCTGDSLTFPISNIDNNPPGTLYKFFVNDGTDTIVLNHPAPPSITIKFNKSSCGVFSNFNNSYKLDVLAINPCGFSPVTVNAIYVSQKPKPNFTISPSSTICSNNTIRFNNIGTTGETIDQGAALGDCNKGKLLWDISPATGWEKINGSFGIDPGSPLNINPWTSGDNQIDVRFNTPGNYLVKLRMGSVRCGIVDTIKTICINPTPTASFTTDVSEGCGPLTVKATGITNVATCGSNTFFWSVDYSSATNCLPSTSSFSFINGANSSSQNPEFVFNNPGVYTIKLKTFSPDGSCSSSTITKQITVKAKPNITLSGISNICINQTISPSMIANCYIDGSTTYNWSLPDGTPSSSTSTSISNVSFSSSGNKTITASATNICGTTTQATSIVVTAVPTVADISGGSSLCVGSTLSLSNTTAGGSWSSTVTSVATVNSSGVVSALSQGTVTINYTVTTNGCSKTVSKVIIVNPLPNVSLPATTSICTGTSTSISVTGNADSYSWSPATALSATTGATVTANPTSQTTYTVTGTIDLTGCSKSASITVNVNTRPSLLVGSTNVCIGNSATLSASGANTYSWSPSSGLNTTIGSSVTANVTTTTIYTVTGSSVLGCTSTATATVTVNPRPSISVDPKTICLGSSAILEASGANSYTWSGGFLSSTTGSTVNASPVSTTVYTVTGKLDATNCSNTTTVTVNVNPLPNVTVNSPSICPNTSVDLIASGADTYSWTPTSTLSLSSGATVKASPITTTTYTVVGENSATGCKKSVESQVSIVSIPLISISSIGPTTCGGTNGSFSISGLTANTTYTVYYNLASSPNSVTQAANSLGVLTVSGLSKGSYTNIYVSISDCKSNEVASIELKDPDAPSQPTIVNTTTKCSGENLTLQLSNPQSSATYTWSGPGGYTGTGSSITISNAQTSATGNYNVVATAKNCQSPSATVTATVYQTPPQPTATDVVYCQNETPTQLIATSEPGNSLLWYTTSISNTAISTAPTPSTSVTDIFSYYVSQKNTDGCESSRKEIKVNVNATPSITDQSGVFCSGEQISFTPSGTSSGTVYSWSIPIITASGALSGATEENNYVSSISQLLTNLTNGIATATYTVKSKAGTCQGSTFNFVATIKPKPILSSVDLNTICSGESFTYTPIVVRANELLPANTKITWRVLSITPANSINGASASSSALSNMTQTLINKTNVKAKVVYELIPISDNCNGSTFTLSIDVEPRPSIQNFEETICSGQTFSVTPVHGVSGNIIPSNTLYSWQTPVVQGTNPVVITGGSAQSSGVNVITQQLVNTTTFSQQIRYTVSPVAGSCIGSDFTVNINLNPQPNIAPKRDTICSGTAFNIIPDDAPTGTTYTWAAPIVQGSANVNGVSQQTLPVAAISKILTSNSNAPAKVIYNILPSAGSCGGSGFPLEVVVNPIPVVPTLKDTICTAETFNILPEHGEDGVILPRNTTYTWSLPTSNPAGSITGGASENTPNAVISQKLSNASNAPGIITYNVTPRSGEFGFCTGPVFDAIVLVNPDAKAEINPTDTEGCPPYLINPSKVRLITYDQRNKDYIWYVDGALNGTGTGNPVFTMDKKDDTSVLKLIVTSLYGCKSDSLTKKFITYKIPEPDFSISDSVGCGPLKISFVNKTPDMNVFTYKWNFGNGLTSAKPNPDAVTYFSNPNYGDTIYNVRLDVTSSCNLVSTESKIRVKSPPKVFFSPSSTIGCSPLKVDFNNISRGINNRYVWDFGDGQKDSTLTNTALSHTYYTSVRDTFYVKLYAINECGKDSATYSIIVTPNTLKLDVAVNGAQKEGCAPHKVDFINNTIGATIFRWDFADGNTKNTVTNNDTINHSFLQPGTYKVVVFASNGCSDSTTTEEIKVYGIPSPDFIPNKVTACIGDSIFFSNKSSFADTYLWKMGDGRTFNFINPGHRYSNSGDYTVRLIAYKTNSPGIVCSDSIDRVIQIVDTVNIDFKLSDSVANCAPLKVTFQNGFKNNLFVQWNFDDGTILRGDSVEHTFMKTGSYNVRLDVKATTGCNYVGNKKVVINSPTGIVNYKSGYNCINEEVRFEAVPVLTDSIKWDFGDGKTFTTDQRVVYHKYDNPGAYLPTVTFISNQGCIYSVIMKDSIKVDKITAGFTFKKEEFCGYTKLDFIDTTQSFYPKASIEWKFGDGKQGNQFKNSNTYTATNTYLVESIVTSFSGCTDTAFMNIPVFVRNIPRVQIGGDTVACTEREFKLKAFVLSQDSITVLKWITSTGSIVYGDLYKNTYSQTGRHDFTFIAGSKFGCYDTVSTNFTVYPTPVIRASSDITVCKGSNFDLSVTGTDTYTWSPADALSCTNCASPRVTPLQNMRYTVRGSSKFGCSAFDTVLVTVIPDFKLKLSMNRDTICIGDSVQFLVTGANTYEWSPTESLSADKVQNPIAKPVRTTQYRVVGFDEFGCFRDTAYALIGVGQYPTLDLGPDLKLATGALYALSPTFTQGPIKTWNWTPFKDLSCVDCPNPMIRVRNEILYQSTITNYFGCSATDSVRVTVFCENSQVYIPNAFTPEGEYNNRIFMVRASGIQQVKSFRIFNRWGQMIFDRANFDANDPKFGWDGRINGVVPGPDVFVYTVEVICDDGTPYFFKGNVTLLK